MPVTMGVAVAAPIVTGVIGDMMSKGDREKAAAARAAALAAIQGVHVPTVEEQRVILEQLRSAGELTPQLEQDILNAPTKMESVKVDPRLREAQMTALAKMQGLGRTGLNADDRLALGQARDEANRASQGQQQAIMQNMAARGMLGSGDELAARMMASQNATNQVAAQGDRTAAMAQQRALEAIMNSGTMAGSIADQRFNQDKAVASAQDEIARFNTANRISTQSRNVNTSNAAQDRNLTNAQSIMNQNVGIKNQAEMYNKGLVQQKYQNDFQKAQSTAGALSGDAAAKDASAQRTANQVSGIGQGIAQGATAYGQYSAQQDLAAKKKNPWDKPTAT